MKIKMIVLYKVLQSTGSCGGTSRVVVVVVSGSKCVVTDYTYYLIRVIY